jgi:hypothetical protein
MHARMKEKEEKPPELIVSCGSRVLSIHDKKNSSLPKYLE